MTGDTFIFVFRNTRLEKTNRCTVDFDGWYCAIDCYVYKILLSLYVTFLYYRTSVDDSVDVIYIRLIDE